tara:strand:- start:29 stop:583 length:555 start_codon:yes stop_codon:yes gene_type:complete
MVKTTTKAIKLGFKAPSFHLFNPFENKIQSLNELKSSKATVLIFMCNHCPYVVHIVSGLVKLANKFIPEGVSFISINSNDITKYPEDSPERMIDFVHNNNLPFPYLFDETQEVAKLYHASCTPDFSVFDGDMKCIYRGQMDSSRPGSGIPVNGEDLRLVLESLLNNKPLNMIQKPSVGCNIKWK